MPQNFISPDNSTFDRQEKSSIVLTGGNSQHIHVNEVIFPTIVIDYNYILMQ